MCLLCFFLLNCFASECNRTPGRESGGQKQALPVQSLPVHDSSYETIQNRLKQLEEKAKNGITEKYCTKKKEIAAAIVAVFSDTEQGMPCYVELLPENYEFYLKYVKDGPIEAQIVGSLNRICREEQDGHHSKIHREQQTQFKSKVNEDMSIEITETRRNKQTKTEIVIYEKGNSKPELPKKTLNPKANKRKPPNEEIIEEFTSSIQIQRVLGSLLNSKSKNQEQLYLDAEKYQEITSNWEGKFDLTDIGERFKFELEEYKRIRGEDFSVEDVKVAIEKGSNGVKDSVRIQFKVDQFEKMQKIFILKKDEKLLSDFHAMQRIDFETLWWSLRDEIVSSSSNDEADVNLESLKMEGSKDHPIVLD